MFATNRKSASRRPAADEPTISLTDAALSAWHWIARHADDVPGARVILAELEEALGLPCACRLTPEQLDRYADEARGHGIRVGLPEGTVDLGALARDLHGNDDAA